MALQGEGFYPGVITINEEDTINWALGGASPHTVSFLSGGTAPPPGSPDSLAPVVRSSYNGTGIASSGIMVPGMGYSLMFTKAGVYTYQCLIHPGMGGVVVVQPAGSRYPFTQAQYTVQGRGEFMTDLDVGRQAVEKLHPNSARGPNDTTVWQVAADIPLPEKANVHLSPKIGSSANGNAELEIVGPGTLKVMIELSGLAPNSVHPAHIHAGTCAAGGTIAYPLNNLIADSEGKVTNTTLISVPPWLAILSRGWFVNVHRGPTMSDGGATPIACGDVIKHDAAYMRFTPGTLKIQTGDTVVWTQMNPMEIHTVTFPVAGQPLPELVLPNLTLNPAAVMRSGGNNYNGTDFFNSGVLAPGQKYSLTFTKPGTYDYLCLVHDEMNMTGKVTVLPPRSISGTKFNDANGNRIKDQNEKGIANWTIMLVGFDKRAMTVVKRTAVTDADGNYIFTDLSSGQYTVTEELMPGWAPITSPARSISLGEGEGAVANFGNRKVLQESTSDVRLFSDGSVVPGASSRLLRTGEGVTMTLHTSELNASDAVTIWWVVFNKPENCTQGHFGLRCAAGDLGNATTQPSVMFAAGNIADAGGKASFGGRLAVGDTKGCPPGFPCNGGLTNPMGADIHLIVHSHGTVIPEMLHEQLSTFGGGCKNAPPGTGKPGPNTCKDVQFSAHEAGKDP